MYFDDGPEPDLDEPHPTPNELIVELDGECGPEVEVCTDCDDLVTIVETSIETTGALETERDYHVTRLSCGHEIAVPTNQKGRTL